MRDEEHVAEIFERSEEIDHLVFTAGDDFTPRPLAELDLEDAHATLDVRFWGAVTVIKYAIGRLGTTGSISLTTGTIGQRPVPGAALAAAGASAAEGLVRGLAVELARSESTPSVPVPSERPCGTAFRHRSAMPSSIAWHRAHSWEPSANRNRSPCHTSI